MTTIGIDAAATSDPACDDADASALRHSVHTDAVITSTVSNHSQRTVYSKYGPKMRGDRHDRQQPGDAEQRVQVQLGRGPSRSGGPNRQPPEHEQADEPDDGDGVERVAAGTEHPRSEQVELDDDDLGDVTEPEVRTIGMAEVVDQDRHVAG